MFLKRTYSPTEIQCGLAVFLGPVELRDHMERIGTSDVIFPSTGLDKHYFLVLARDGDTVAITPLMSHPNGPGWVRLEGKLGHPGWVDPATFYHPSQIWPATVDAVIAAARAAADLTWPGDRNRVVGHGLNEVLAAFRRARDGDPNPGSLAFSWRAFWARYRTGEIWEELRMSSVVFGPRRVRFVTGRA